MSQKKKLIKRLKSMPSDYTFDEAASLLRFLDYKINNKGKTSGSRVEFINDNDSKILLHRPHPDKTLKRYQLKLLIETLEKEGLI